MISDLLAILLLSLACFLFWQQRRQAELAKAIALRKCNELNLQLLSVALKGHKLKMPSGTWLWHSVYQLEFSSQGDDCYQGKIWMRGFKLIKVELAPHRI